MDDNLIRSGLEYQSKDIVNIIILKLDLIDQIKLSFTSKKILNKIKVTHVTDKLNILTNKILRYQIFSNVIELYMFNNLKVTSIYHLSELKKLSAISKSEINQTEIAKFNYFKC